MITLSLADTFLPPPSRFRQCPNGKVACDFAAILLAPGKPALII